MLACPLIQVIQQPLYMCFVDFKKALDCISHDKLSVNMMDIGYTLHVVVLLAILCRKQLAKVKVAGRLSGWFRVKKGVRQGCVLSSYLFNTLAEMVMRETLDGFQGGLQIGRRMITNLRYADGIILFATSTGVGGSPTPSQPQIQPTHQRRQDQCNGERWHSVPRTQVDTFPYLGSLITEDGECTTEVRTRLNRGQAIVALLQKI